MVGHAEIPVQKQIFAFRVADDPLTVAPELGIVGRKEQKPSEHPLAEVLYDRPLTEVGVDPPMWRHRPEVHDPYMAARRSLTVC